MNTAVKSRFIVALSSTLEMTGSIRLYPMTGLMSSTRERTLIKLDVATQRNHSKPQYQGTSS